MIKIGKSLAIRQDTDRWGQLIPSWSVDSYGWIEEERWEKIKDYQTPVTILNPPEVMEAIKTAPTSEQAFKILIESPIGIETKRKMSLPPKPYTLWEFNALAPNKDDYIRMVAVFGEHYLVEWSDFDVYVKYPILQLICKIKNYYARSSL